MTLGLAPEKSIQTLYETLSQNTKGRRSNLLTNNNKIKKLNYNFRHLNPEFTLDFVAKLNYSIKGRAHGLFLKM